MIRAILLASATVTRAMRRLGDEIDQAAWYAGILMTSMPFWRA